MTSISKSITALLAYIGLLFLGCASCALAEEQPFTNFSCAITVPDDWHPMTNMAPQPALVGAFADFDQTRIVLVMVDGKNKPTGPVDDQFITQFEQGITHAGGGQRVSGKYIEIAGIKAYERIGSLIVKQKHASTVARVLAANGRYYTMEALQFNGDASNDSGIQSVLDSFRFTEPPVQIYSQKSAAYQLGYVIGKLGGTIFMVGLVIGGAIVIIVSLLKNRKSGSAKPPPLPPNIQ